jgi:hypothetical protein
MAKSYTVKKVKELVEKAFVDILQERAEIVNSYTSPKPAHKRFSPRLFPPRLFVIVPAQSYEEAFKEQWELMPDFTKGRDVILKNLKKLVENMPDRKKVNLTDIEVSAINGS